MRLKITLLIIVGNGIGATLSYLFFNHISPVVLFSENVPQVYYLFYSIVSTCIIFAVTIWITQKWIDPLYQVIDGKVSLKDLDRTKAERLQRKAIQYAAFSAGTTFLAWVMAGFIIGVLMHIFFYLFFGVEQPSLMESLRMFFGITFIGGSLTTLFVYFATENVWQKAIPTFFPEGNLSHVTGAFKLNVNTRLLIVFLVISLIPPPLLGIAAYAKAQALYRADAVLRARILSSLSMEIIFITAICVITSVVLAVFVSRSVSVPLGKMKMAMKGVEGGKLDVLAEILSNDEIGAVAEGFNYMLHGLKESEEIKESFGKYVSQEIRDEIIKGNVSTDGEMKRVTLLFSDLRDFTPFVESTNPKQVVAIMNRYFSEMTEAIKQNRGLVLQYVGDEIEAVFGAPVSYDDHPDMAVKAALEMRRRLKTLNQHLEEEGMNPLQHGIGIHTGAVLAGNIGSKDRISYALVGDTVNLASRIEGLTKEYSCDIMLSQTNRSLLTGNYLTEQLSAVKVKGRKEDVIIHKLIDQA